MGNGEPRPGDTVRRLLRAADRAAMATHLSGRGDPALQAWPYTSLVLLACDHDATPLLLISDLAEHSKNIAEDARVALLIDGTAGRVDPLTGPRATILGRAEKTDDGRLKSRFVARHPSAALYADFADFHLYRVAVAQAHFVAGFGRIHWINAADVGFAAGPAATTPVATTPAWADGEEALVARLNGAAGMADRLARLGTGRQANGWRVTGVDPEGIDLRRDGSVSRLEFPAPADDPDAAAAAIDGLLQAAKPRRA